MIFEQIQYETRDDVAVVTLNRPARLNAWTEQMTQELLEAAGQANDDERITAIVITGAGRAFCAGADVSAQFEPRSANGRGSGKDAHLNVAWVELCRSSKPMVAAINGPAIGIGLTLIITMDQLLASDRATLSCRFVKMGVTPELASSRFLVQRCGWGAASDLALSGRTLDAAEALEVGLVDSVVPHDELLDAAIAKAREYGSNPGPQLRMIKRLLTENAVESDLSKVQRREQETLEVAFATPEFAEAVSAFLEKREPRFR